MHRTVPVIVAILVSVAMVGWLLVTAPDTPAPDQRPDGSVFTPRAGAVDDARVKRAAIDEPGAWIAYGRTHEQHRHASLTAVNRDTVADLGIAWVKPLDTIHRLQATPLIVDGVMYVTDPMSVVYALDAATGATIWRFDPQIRGQFVRFSCCGGPMNRGVAVYGGRVFVATFDARLVAIDAADGTKLWDVDTNHAPDEFSYTISGAPLVAAGKVYIGNSSSEFGGRTTAGHRGYLSAYDAETGRLAWRFFTVPGNPAEPFEHPELERAAKTWSGEWWKMGGGGTVWNSIVYDPELHTVYIGTGNGAPWPRAIRSPGGGDNLFLSSIVAVDPDTGVMKWFYQTTPGDNWDFAATQHMVLDELEIDGVSRKVLMQAPKNGFFYVLDRETGKLLNAFAYGALNWATHVDLESGRPVEDPAAYYEDNPQWILPGNAAGPFKSRESVRGGAEPEHTVRPGWLWPFRSRCGMYGFHGDIRDFRRADRAARGDGSPGAGRARAAALGCAGVRVSLSAVQWPVRPVSAPCRGAGGDLGCAGGLDGGSVQGCGPGRLDRLVAGTAVPAAEADRQQ